MVEPGSMEAPEGGADPFEQRRFGVGQAFRQRPGGANAHRDQGRRVTQATASDTGGDRPRYREPELVEMRGKPEFTEGAGALEAGPQVAGLVQPRHQAAAAVGAQHPLLAPSIEKQAAAAPGSFADHTPGLVPVGGVEQRRVDLWRRLGVTYTVRII